MLKSYIITIIGEKEVGKISWNTRLYFANSLAEAIGICMKNNSDFNLVSACNGFEISKKDLV